MARYNGPGNGEDSANGAALDAANNVYVTGGSWGVGTDFNNATVKYDSDGNQLWVARSSAQGGHNGYDSGRGLALNAGGNVYVTGRSCNGPPGECTSSDIATVKYSQQ